jgi:hypothetical protein
MSENAIWKILFYFQLVAYIAFAGVLVFSAYQTGLTNLVTARWGGWHLLTTMQYLVVIVYCRLMLKRNFWGTVNSISVPLLAGLIGESNFSYLYFIPYYRPFALPAFQNTWWVGTWEFATVAFLGYATLAYKYVRWRRILAGLIALVPLMYLWITWGGFKVSACICNYRLAYYYDFMPNLFEVVYYSILFLFFLWALRFEDGAN